MSLPTVENLLTLDFDWYGQPFCEVPAKSGIDLDTIDYDWYGQPFVSNDVYATTGMSADVPVGLMKFAGVAPATSKAAATPVGLMKVVGVAPATAKNAAVPVGLAKLTGIAPAANRSIAVPAGLLKFTPQALKYIYTTVQAGAWNDPTTWDGGGVPGVGNRAILNHAVNATANVSIGDSPSDTSTDVVTINAAGTLTVQEGITFRLRGNMALVNGGHLVIGEVTGGGAFIFDATDANDPTTQYICKVGVANGETISKVTTRGDAVRSIVKSEVGSGHGYFGSGTSAAQNDRSGTGWMDLAFTDFLRIGDAAKHAFYINPVDDAKAHQIERCDFESCGDIYFESVPASISLVMHHVTQRGSLGPFGLKFGSTVATPVTGSRSLTQCVFDKAITYSACDSVIEDCILQNSFGDAAGNGRFASFQNNFVRWTDNNAYWRGGDWNECYLCVDGSTYNSLTGLYTATADINNPHWTTPERGPTGMYEVLYSIFEGWGSSGDGDIDYGPNTTGYNSRLRHCLILPDQQSDTPANSAIVNDDNAGAGVTYTGTWSRYAPFEMHYADPQANTNNALLTFTPGAGTYNVKFSWPAAAADGTRASAKLEIYDDTTLLDTKFFDQTVAPNDFSETGRDYENVGDYTIATATLKVKLYADAVKYVLLDAVRIISTVVNPGVPRNSGTLTTCNGWGGAASEYEHCTFYSGGQGPLALAEAGNGYSHMVAKYLSNIIWNDAAFIAAGFNYMAYLPTSPPGAVTDMIDPANCDFNNGWGVRNDGTNVGSNTNLHYNIPLSATVGVNDLYVDPQFVDKTRCFWKWVESIAGATLPGNPTPSRTDYNAYGLTQLSKLNDSDFDTAYTLAALKVYLRGGYAPQNLLLKDAGGDGVTTGAVEGDYGIMADVPTGLIKLLAVAPATRKAAPVPVGVLHIAAVAPATTKQAALGVGVVEFLGLPPVSSNTVEVSVGLIEFVGTPLTIARGAPVPVGAMHFTSVVPVSAKRVDVTPAVLVFVAPAIAAQGAQLQYMDISGPAGVTPIHVMGTVGPSVMALSRISIGGTQMP